MSSSNYTTELHAYNDKGIRPPKEYEWEELASEAGIAGDTTFDEPVVDIVWNKCCGFLPWRAKIPELTQAYFYIALIYLAYYPTKEQMPRILTTAITGPISYSTFRRHVLPLLMHLAAGLQQCGFIDWERRLQPTNHHPNFQHYVTTMVDCFPMTVQEPTNKDMARLLYQPKYGACCLKGEVVATLTGEIVAFSFPHLGIRGDSRVWQEQTKHHHLLLPNEICIGDGAYIACEGVLTKYTKCGVSGPMTRGHKIFNKMFNAVRQRIEHVIGHIKRRALFRLPFRGSLEQASAFVTIIAHFVNARTRLSGGLYEGFGNWSHFPNQPTSRGEAEKRVLDGCAGNSGNSGNKRQRR